jgi:hypothetical protein
MQAQVREVLNRVLTDDAFLDQMLTNPQQALRPYDLTDEERSILASPHRDLLDLMRIGTGPVAVSNIDFTLDLTLDLELDLTLDLELDLTLDLTIDLDLAAVEARQAVRKEQIAALARTVAAAKSRTERLEQIQHMLQVVSGATELARGSSGDGPVTPASGGDAPDAPASGE